MGDQKNSLLIRKQIPEFILEDSPRFLSFLEAYYEFLDINSNGVSKDLRYVSDVDQSLDLFEQQFFNSFIPFIPKNTAISKDFIIKNIMPLYLSKGSVSSYQYLFRLLFGEEVSVSYPGQSVLRASDGRWNIDNVLRVTETVFSEYISDGIQVIYYLPEPYTSDKFSVTVDGLLVTNYQTFVETQKIVFSIAPNKNSIIKINYPNFNINLLNNRKVVGEKSSATALIENTGTRKITGSAYFEFLINQKTLLGNFINGEIIYSDIVVVNNLIPLIFQTFADLEYITIVNGGSSYNIGDPVIIRGDATKKAIAIVSDVADGDIKNLLVDNGGCGFFIGENVIAESYSTNIFNARIATYDTQGIFSSNSVSYNTDIIGDYGSITINSSDYGFPANGTENLTTTIAAALSSNTVNNLGGITSVNVSTSLISSQLRPNFDVVPLSLPIGCTLRDLGIIGKITIVNGGIGYQAGDSIIFTNSSSFQGQGAKAVVRSVNSLGTINTVNIIDGGLSYVPGYFPNLSVISANGRNANLTVEGIMGDGEVLIPILGNTVAGQILSIKILDNGVGYVADPVIDLSTFGDGNAKANGFIQNSYVNQGGRWTTTDGILSSEEIVLQGRDYYIDFSYVTTASVEFSKYKKIVKQLLHPAGLVNYAKYSINENIFINSTISMESELSFNLSNNITFLSINNENLLINLIPLTLNS